MGQKREEYVDIFDYDFFDRVVRPKDQKKAPPYYPDCYVFYDDLKKHQRRVLFGALVFNETSAVSIIRKMRMMRQELIPYLEEQPVVKKLLDTATFYFDNFYVFALHLSKREFLLFALLFKKYKLSDRLVTHISNFLIYLLDEKNVYYTAIYRFLRLKLKSLIKKSASEEEIIKFFDMNNEILQLHLLYRMSCDFLYLIATPVGWEVNDTLSGVPSERREEDVNNKDIVRRENQKNIFKKNRDKFKADYYNIFKEKKEDIFKHYVLEIRSNIHRLELFRSFFFRGVNIAKFLSYQSIYSL